MVTTLGRGGADALFCKRNENAMNGVDKMENAMQNIILQEMETLGHSCGDHQPGQQYGCGL